MSVNLPRWGLKRQIKETAMQKYRGVNLPRWGLKHRRGEL